VGNLELPLREPGSWDGLSAWRHALDTFQITLDQSALALPEARTDPFHQYLDAPPARAAEVVEVDGQIGEEGWGPPELESP
jgi:hypothetical protein